MTTYIHVLLILLFNKSLSKSLIEPLKVCKNLNLCERPLGGGGGVNRDSKGEFFIGLIGRNFEPRQKL
jgi:hypothetical protein